MRETNLKFSPQEIEKAKLLKQRGLDWKPKKGDWVLRTNDNSIFQVREDFDFPFTKYFTPDGEIKTTYMTYVDNNLVWLPPKELLERR